LVFKYYLNTPKCEVFHKVFKYSGQSICYNTDSVTLCLLSFFNYFNYVAETGNNKRIKTVYVVFSTVAQSIAEVMRYFTAFYSNSFMQHNMYKEPLISLNIMLTE